MLKRRVTRQLSHHSFHSGMAEDARKLAFKGSCKTVTDYFEFAIHNILFQRGIYPAEDFATVRKYALPLLLSTDEEVVSYIAKIMHQIKRWVYGKRVLKLALVIISRLTGEPVERWEFSIHSESKDGEDDEPSEGRPREVVQKEIQAIIRQITSLAAYLPVLDDPEGEGHTFNVVVHADPNANAPAEWLDTNGDDRQIPGEHEKVDFSAFKTSDHCIGTQVAYRVNEFSRN